MAAYSLSTITDIVCEEVSYLLGEEGDSVNNVENDNKNEDENKVRNNDKKNKNRIKNESKNNDRTNNERGTTQRKVMKFSDIVRKLIIFSCFSATFLLSASRSASNYVNYSGKKLTLFSHFVCFVFFCFFVFLFFCFVCLIVCFAFNIVSWLHSSLICQLIAYPLFVNITLSLTHLLSHSLSSCLSMSLSISVTRTFLSYDHASLYHASSVFLHHHLFLILSTFSFHVHFIFFSSPLISTLILQIHILHLR